MVTEQAKWAARRELGNVALLMEDTRAAWGWTSLERFWQDLRFSARTLRKNRGFAAAVTLSLALGIGAITAIFSLLNAVVMRPLPVAEPAQLVQFTNTQSLWETGNSNSNSLFGYPEFERFQAHSNTVAGIFGGTGLGRIVIGFRGTSGMARGDAYTDNFFSILGITPQHGRFFSPGEDAADASASTTGAYLAVFVPGSAFASGALASWAHEGAQGHSYQPGSRDQLVATQVTSVESVASDTVGFGVCVASSFVIVDSAGHVLESQGGIAAGHGVAVRVDGRWLLRDLSLSGSRDCSAGQGLP